MSKDEIELIFTNELSQTDFNAYSKAVDNYLRDSTDFKRLSTDEILEEVVDSLRSEDKRWTDAPIKYLRVKPENKAVLAIIDIIKVKIAEQKI